jgi:hypothetical protein
LRLGALAVKVFIIPAHQNKVWPKKAASVLLNQPLLFLRNFAGIKY